MKRYPSLRAVNMEKKTKVQDAIDNSLLDQRKIFLWGMVEDSSAKHVIDRLLYLDSINNDEIQLFINSPGGYVTSGFAMYDTISKSRVLYLLFAQDSLQVWDHYYYL